MTINASSKLPAAVNGVEDGFSNLEVGIVHFGVGAFHRAHQAVYTHDVLSKHGGNWRILGVSLQSTQIADDLNAQDGIYTLVIRQAEDLDLKLIKSIKNVEAAVRRTDVIFKHLASPKTHIVSMTVTEKAYGIFREEKAVDINHKSIAHDLENPDAPIGIIGIIVKGLSLRKQAGLKPFTVLCCDNLPKNGDLVRSGVLDFALKTNQVELVKWIEQEGAFPNSMVDRITPATTSELIEEVASHLGDTDKMPVETEPFSQWVIEDNFCDGRPRWQDVGALFVSEVAPYEHMKLRMLNGTHSMIAYAGFLCGHKYVRDVMADENLEALAFRHMQAAAQTLVPLKEIDFEVYAKQLIKRFENPNIAHETYQIAMDGSQKMPQRIFEPAVDALRLGLSIEPFAFATAAWIFYCSGKHESGSSYKLRDPREEELLEVFKGSASNPDLIVERFLALPDLFPNDLIKNAQWSLSITAHLSAMIDVGIVKAIGKL